MLGRILVLLALCTLGGYVANRFMQRPVGWVRAALSIATMNGVLVAFWLTGWNSLTDEFGLLNVFATANAFGLAFLLGLKLALKSTGNKPNDRET